MHDALRRARYRRLRVLREALSDRILNINTFVSTSTLNYYTFGLAPAVIIRLHTRAVSNIIDYYYVLAIEEVFTRISRAAVKDLVAVKRPEYLDKLSNIDRSLAAIENRLPNYLLGVVLGYHGAKPSNTRLLNLLDDIELKVGNSRTLEIGIDHFSKPMKNIRKITGRIRHTKFYTYRLRP
ncbi:MAG: hypothetical protein DRO14_04735 [Thermoprotei archaeon]|nr:MAG: hypothetical protein DRO14_04735 [Thermoprotei archaeon]